MRKARRLRRPVRRKKADRRPKPTNRSARPTTPARKPRRLATVKPVSAESTEPRKARRFAAVCEPCKIYCTLGEHQLHSASGREVFCFGSMSKSVKDRDKLLGMVAEFVFLHVACKQAGVRVIEEEWVPWQFMRWVPGGKRRMPRPKTDADRCWAGFAAGNRCALDKGHFRPREDPDPSPHVAEDGQMWF